MLVIFLSLEFDLYFPHQFNPLPQWIRQEKTGIANHCVFEPSMEIMPFAKKCLSKKMKYVSVLKSGSRKNYLFIFVKGRTARFQ